MVDKQDALVAGTQNSFKVIVANDAPTLSAQAQVQTGSTVNGIFLNIEANATSSAALANMYIAVIKNPGGNLTLPQANQIGTNDNKRFVIHQEMIMFQQQTNSNPRTLFKGVIVIPRGYRRMAPNDELTILLLAPGVNVNYCIQCHYKEFR